MAHLQIRDVPPELHRLLKRRARAAGMSLSEYLRAEVERVARRPDQAELLARIRRRVKAGDDLADQPARLIRAARDA